VLFFPVFFSAQIKLKELPPSNSNEVEKLLFGSSNYRKILNLESGWRIYPLDNPGDAVNISVPSNFEGETTLVYEKTLTFSQEEFNNYKFLVHFLGVNYYSEILINNFVIYKSNTDIPFDIEIPKDLIKPNYNNILSIKVSFRPDSENTIPFKQRFLGPKNLGGLIRNVIMEYVPYGNAELASFNYNLDSYGKVKLNCKLRLDLARKTNDSTQYSNDYKVIIYLTGKNSSVPEYKTEQTLSYSKNIYFADLNIELAGLQLWRPENPYFYHIKTQLLNGNQIIDESEKTISFYHLSLSGGKTLLNGSEYLLSGTTYHISNSYYGNIISLYNLREDLTAIKKMGFNSVRFPQALPNPLALRLCEEIGLFVFAELPVNSLPSDYAGNSTFLGQSKGFLSLFIDKYSNYSAICAFGAGSGYLASSEKHNDLIRTFADIIKSKTNRLVYASFTGFPQEQINNVDLYGVELFGKSIKSLDELFKDAIAKLGKCRLFISEATYPVYKGSTSGYINEFSIEAQAQYFSNIINYTVDNGITGFFINSLFDYAGDFSSLFTSYNPAKDYNVGILGKDKNEFSLSYKALFSKLHDGEKVTIPIGAKKDDNKIFFILIALALSVMMAVLINTKRKFREDCTRALIRPYNFFADIRDRRILSGVHASILMVIIIGSLSLLIAVTLYFLKANILLEKILLSFGSRRVLNFISYLAWNPLQAFVILFIILSAKFGFVSLLIKTASFFIKTKVSIQSIMFMIVWAMLPVVLLLPLELVLYKVLSMNIANLYIYIFITLFLLWILQRILKGIYVIFDVRPFVVYFYSLLVMFLLAGGVILYYQFSNSAIYFIINAFKQSSLI